MDGSQAGSDNESDWGETPLDEPPFDETPLEDILDEAVDNLNWPVQPDPEDSRYFDSSQLNGGETFQQPDLATGAQYPANNYSSSYAADSTAYDGISLEAPINPSWQPSWPDLELNSVPIDPNLYQAQYSTTTRSFSSPLYGFHNSSLVGSSSVPYNYYRQPDELDNQRLYLSPSVPSAQSVASDVLSVQSAPYSPLARTNNSTLLSSYFPGTPQQSGPVTEQSFEGSRERTFSCGSCDSRFGTRKDLDRHRPIHNQWPEGQRVDGSYHCRCGMRTHRKDNYKRHHKACSSEKYKHATFICACSSETNDQADHLSHIEDCLLCKKRRGRPPGKSGSRSRAVSCTAG